MTTPVFTLTPSFTVSHTMRREFLSNRYSDGYLHQGTAETALSRADGVKGVSSYKGLNVFTIALKNAQGYADGTAERLWDFLAERLENYNEPFYFYNPTECFPPDPTGAETRGRYLVKIQKPETALSRDMARWQLHNFGISFEECREFGDVDDVIPTEEGTPTTTLSASPTSEPDEWVQPAENADVSYTARGDFAIGIEFKFMCQNQSKPFIPYWQTELDFSFFVPENEFVPYNAEAENGIPVGRFIRPYAHYVNMPVNAVAVVNEPPHSHKIYWTTRIYYNGEYGYWDAYQSDLALIDFRYLEDPENCPDATMVRVYYSAFKPIATGYRYVFLYPVYMFA